MEIVHGKVLYFLTDPTIPETAWFTLDDKNVIIKQLQQTIKKREHKIEIVFTTMCFGFKEKKKRAIYYCPDE
jgi:hypothetical protein